MAQSQIDNRTLFTGDNLEVMRAMNSATVDLIYLDPPFNKKIIFPIGKGDNKEFGYKDIWGWESAPNEHNPFLPYAELYAFDELVAAENNGNPLIDGRMAKKIVRFLETMGEISGHPEMAYLSFMAARLVEMKRLLKPTGSIYLHCDPTMSHSLKLLMDIVFGEDNFQNEIVWTYRTGGSTVRRFSRKHDLIFFYTKSDTFRFNMPLEKSYTKSTGRKPGVVNYGAGTAKFYRDAHGVYNFVNMRDVWDISYVGSTSKERTGYPTQKPLELLERIIEASSEIGSFILDPFCGCATTCIAAERLNREWCGIDVASHAVNLVKKRLTDETKQGKIGERIPKIYHYDFNKGECPIRSDLGERRSKDIKKLLYGQQAGTCNLCKRHFEMQNFHIDHITPKSKGGPDVDRNLQLLCGSCNTIKGTRSMEIARNRLRELGYIKAA